MLRLAFFAYLAAAHAYLWPSPQLDALEGMRFQVDASFVDFIQPCDAFSFAPDDRPSGRSNLADWVRTVRALLPPGIAEPDMRRHTTTWRHTIVPTAPVEWTAQSGSPKSKRGRRYSMTGIPIFFL